MGYSAFHLTSAFSTAAQVNTSDWKLLPSDGLCAMSGWSHPVSWQPGTWGWCTHTCCNAWLLASPMAEGGHEMESQPPCFWGSFIRWYPGVCNTWGTGKVGRQQASLEWWYCVDILHSYWDTKGICFVARTSLLDAHPSAIKAMKCVRFMFCKQSEDIMALDFI